MSDTAGDPFRGRTVFVMLALGIVGFVGMLVLGAYAPDLRSGRTGGNHALSNAATGFGGIVRLAAATGRNPIILRNVHRLDSEDLLIVTPEHGWDDLNPILQQRAAKPTLLVFPKWNGAPDDDHPGWVTVAGPLPPHDPDRMLAPSVVFPIARRRAGPRRWLTAQGDFPAEIRFARPRLLQVITGAVPARGSKAEQLTPLLTDGAGGIVLARYGEQPLYLLADPDLMANAGIRDVRQAAAALVMLDWLNSTGAGSIGFDVTTNGLDRSESPLKLAFGRPFVSVTLVLGLVVLLLGWRAVVRFGPVEPRGRAIALGKGVLVDNSARLVARAGRELRVGRRYVQLVRERAAAAFAAPARLTGEALDGYLDRIGGGRARFGDLAAAVEAAPDLPALVTAGRALHAWYREGRI